jgi:hypothetical protein
MNFGLNSVNFRNVKRKIRFGPHRNGRISPKFGLIWSNPRTLVETRGMVATPFYHFLAPSIEESLRCCVLCVGFQERVGSD